MINQALKRIREFHNIKQNELAITIGISNSYLSEIENGKKAPSLELLQKYSKTFDIPVSSLLYFSEELDSNSSSSIGKLKLKSKKFLLRILEWSESIDEREKKT